MILLNTASPGRGTRESVNAVLASPCEAKILVMAVETEVASVKGALDAGSSGYILEDASRRTSSRRSARSRRAPATWIPPSAPR